MRNIKAIITHKNSLSYNISEIFRWNTNMVGLEAAKNQINLMSSLKEIPNYISSERGANVIHYTSESEGYCAFNVIEFEHFNDVQFWISEPPLPQSIYIKIDKNQLQSQICLVGWYCHKRYIFNAREVKFFVAKYYIPKGDDTHFVPWAILTADQVRYGKKILKMSILIR